MSRNIGRIDCTIWTLKRIIRQALFFMSFLRCQDTSDPRHFGPKTFRHWCRSVRKTLRHQCRSVRTLRHWCRNVRKTLRYRSVFDVVCAIVCCDITITSRIGLAWRLCTRRNRFNAVYLKHDGTDRTASASHIAQSPPPR